MLRLRLRTEPALELADEGPPLGARIVLPRRFDATPQARLALAIFSSEGCRMCQSLKPVVAAFARAPLFSVAVFDEDRTSALSAANAYVTLLPQRRGAEPVIVAVPR